MIRDASPDDFAAIRAMLTEAFGQIDEAALVERLRVDDDVLFELVAGDKRTLHGHIVYSRLSITLGGETIEAAALAPLAVRPAFQRQGVGGELIRAGNARCAAVGLSAIIVLGHPEYYPRFGFSSAAAESLQAPFSGPAFLALELRAGALQAGGRVRYAKAFGV